MQPALVAKEYFKRKQNILKNFEKKLADLKAE
jgi:hypothetical protein